MKKLLPFLFALSIGIIACQDDSTTDDNIDPETSGTNQLSPPVMNSGTETETRRAQEAVGQDSTNTVTHIGKDSSGPLPIQSDSSRPNR